MPAVVTVASCFLRQLYAKFCKIACINICRMAVFASFDMTKFIFEELKRVAKCNGISDQRFTDRMSRLR